MDKYVTRKEAPRSSSLESLTNKRSRDDDDIWLKPKRPAFRRIFAGSKDISTQNRFTGLTSDQRGESSSATTTNFVSHNSRNKTSRVPPIIIEIEKKWTHKMILDMVSKFTKTFHVNYRGGGKLAIHCYSGDSHQQLKDGLRTENVAYHTFSRKDEKKHKVVMRGLPACVADNVSGELESLGFKDTVVTKLRSSAAEDKEVPFPPLLIQLPNGADIAKFRKIKYISNCAIQLQKFHPNSSGGIQCFRCQHFGHTSRNCNLPARCVKCTGEHPTKECPITERTEAVACCNCKEKHPANYRECKERVKYLQNLETRNNNLKALKEPKTMSKLNGRSYADVITGQYQHPKAAAVSTSSMPPQKTNHTGYSFEHAVNVNDQTTNEMLEILTVIKNIKVKFQTCHNMMEKVILVLQHLGSYV